MQKLKKEKKKKKSTHVDVDAAEIHATQKSFKSEKRTKTEKDWDGQLKRMDVVQLGSLEQM